MGATCTGEEWDCGTEVCDCDGGRAVCGADGANPCDIHAAPEPSPLDAVCDDEAAKRCLASSDPASDGWKTMDGGECAAAVRDACNPFSLSGAACLAAALGPPPPDGSRHPFCGLQICVDLGRATREDCLCDYVVASCSGDGGGDFLAGPYSCDVHAGCCEGAEDRAACFVAVGGTEGKEADADGEGAGGVGAAAAEDASGGTEKGAGGDAVGGTPASPPARSGGFPIPSSLIPAAAASLLLLLAL